MKHTFLALLFFTAVGLMADSLPVTPGKWGGKVILLPNGGPDGEAVVKVSGPGLSSAALDAKAVCGKKLTVTALIKAEEVAEPEKPNLGVKLMVVAVCADGTVKYFEGLPENFRSGSYQWKPARTVAEIPADATRVLLSIGIQKATGTVSYADIRCEVGQ